MTGVVVVGAQWGDEGKGKIVDWLSSTRRCGRPLPGRAQCRPHARHRRQDLQARTLLPSGVVRGGKLSVIGNGVVVDPWHLLNEIAWHRQVRRPRLGPDDLILADNASLILPWHKDIDAAREEAAAGAQIGTTRRGIGPAYEDKVGRRAIRVADLADPAALDLKTRSPAGPPPPAPRRPQPAGARRRATEGRAARRSPRRSSPMRSPSWNASTRPSASAAASCSKARRASCSTSTTAPIRSSPRPTSSQGRQRRLRRRARRHQLCPRPRQGLHHPRRRRPVPDRAGQRDRPAPRHDRPRVRHQHRPRPPLRLVRQRDGAAGLRRLRRHRPRPHQARRARRLRRDPDLHGTTSWRQDHQPLPRRHDRSGQRHAQSTKPSKAGKAPPAALAAGPNSPAKP
jgi:hypothetical protein